MFKLIKITNGRINVPELVDVPVDASPEYFANCLYYVSYGTLCTARMSENDLPFIPIETLPMEHSKSHIRGYFVTEDMVFETKLHGDAINASVGSVLEGHCGESGVIDSVEAAEGSTAIVLSNFSAFAKGIVSVALKW